VFSGCYSEQTFSSVDDAVEAYVKNEVEGLATSVDSYDYKIVESSNSSAIVAYADSATDNSEQVELTFSCGNENYTVYMDICYLDDNSLRYRVKPSSTGEVITKSYFDSLLSADKYSNYTVQQRQSGEINLYGVPFKISTNATLKVNEEYGYYRENRWAFSTDSDTQVYIKDGKNGLRCYGILNEQAILKTLVNMLRAFGLDIDDSDFDYSSDTGYQECTLTNIWGTCSSLADFSRVGFPNGIDHTFFVKTDKGFAVNPAKQQEFSKIMLTATGKMLNFSSERLQQMMEAVDFVFDMSYTVYDGRISKMVMTKTATFKDYIINEVDADTDSKLYDFLSNYKVAVSVEALYTDFGSTVIEIPDEVQEYYAN
jgi:hypothetical protein